MIDERKYVLLDFDVTNIIDHSLAFLELVFGFPCCMLPEERKT